MFDDCDTFGDETHPSQCIHLYLSLMPHTHTQAAWETEQTWPLDGWPHSGQVTFDNYSTRYRPGLELVLRGISCTVNAGEKVGM